MGSASLGDESQELPSSDDERDLEQDSVQWTIVRSRRSRPKVVGPHVKWLCSVMRPLRELEAEFNNRRPNLTCSADINTTERAVDTSSAPLQEVMRATISARPVMIQTEPQQNKNNVHPSRSRLCTQRFALGIEDGSLPVMERLFGP